MGKEQVLQYDAKFRDVAFLLGFVVHFLAVIGLLCLGLLRYYSWDDFDSEDDLFISSEGTTQIGILLGCSAVIGFFFGLLWLFLMFIATKPLIYMSFVLSSMLWMLLAVYFFWIGSFFSGVIFLIMGILQLVILYMWRDRIPFAVVMIKKSISLTKKYPATLVLTVISLFFQVGWVFLWGITTSLTLRYQATTAALLFILLLVSFYWTSQVIKNTVHSTTAGTFGTWYFKADSVKNPTTKALKRSLTTSFGSICFGSLLISIVKTIRALVRSVRGSIGFLAVIADCLLSCIDWMLRYFNHYVLVYCALYGKSYWDSAKDTIHMFKHSGISALVNDNISGTILGMGAIFGGFVTAAITGGVAFVWVEDDWFFVTVMAFFIGWTLTGITLQVIESAVSTIFVCFAEDPLVLLETDAELYEELKTASKS